MARKFFQKLPIPGRRGTEFEYFGPVDISRYHLGLLTELYEATHVSDGTRFLPLTGSELIVKTTLDTHPLQVIVDDVMVQWEAALLAIGEEGKRAWDGYVSRLPWMQLIMALVGGRGTKAEETLRELLYGLLSLTTTLAGSLDRESQMASAMGEVVDRYSETEIREGSIVGSLLFDWAEAADTLVKSVEELSVIESALERARGRIRPQMDVLEVSADPAVADARLFLDGDAQSVVGFTLTAFQYLQHPDPSRRKEILGAMEEARGHITACRELEEAAAELWGELCGLRDKEALPKRSPARALIRAIEDASVRMRDFERRFGGGTIRPFDLQGSGTPLISQARYETSCRYLASPQWAPRACEQRIGGIFESIDQMLQSRPQLPRDIQDIIQQCAGYIARLDELLAPAPAPPADDIPSDEAADEEDDDKVPPAASHPTLAITDRRADELYDLVICVGYVLTCKKPFFAQSRIRAMLEILVFLGRADSNEVSAYHDSVTDRSKRSGERETVEDSGFVQRRWEESAARWINYQTKRRVWGLKLTKGAAPAACTLLVRYGLSEEDIRAAQRRRREDREERYRARCESQS